MSLTATQINLYHVCWRQLWLHSHEIRMEHTSGLVAEGKVIGESTYGRRPGRWRELVIGNLKIDHYDARNRVVKEVKKSDRLEAAYIAQVKYYLHVLERAGMAGVTGLIEYPTLRRTTHVRLEDPDRQTIAGWEAEIERLLAQGCPPVIHKSYCRTCSYREFCYV